MTRLDEILEAIRGAREIQEFLWDNESWSNKAHFNPAAWYQILTKRTEAILNLDATKPNWKVEARKRFLQLASLSVKGIELLDKLDGKP